jgi:hypothetical protein
MVTKPVMSWRFQERGPKQGNSRTKSSLASDPFIYISICSMLIVHTGDPENMACFFSRCVCPVSEFDALVASNLRPRTLSPTMSPLPCLCDACPERIVLEAIRQAANSVALSDLPLGDDAACFVDEHIKSAIEMQTKCPVNGIAATAPRMMRIMDAFCGGVALYLDADDKKMAMQWSQAWWLGPGDDAGDEDQEPNTRTVGVNCSCWHHGAEWEREKTMPGRLAVENVQPAAYECEPAVHEAIEKALTRLTLRYETRHAGDASGEN